MTANYKPGAIDWKHLRNPKHLSQMILGIAFSVVALKGFMLPNRFLDGGVTGISILLHEFSGINVSVLLLVLNIPFIWLGYKKIGKTFAVQTSIAVVLLFLGLMYIDIKAITTDRLLIAIFGGILIGSGLGLVIRTGCVLDGTEVIAVYTNKMTGFSSSEIIMAMNTLIFAVATIQFGTESAMYSIITYFTATRATNYVVDGIEEFTAMHIISAKPEEIKRLLVNDLGKGITVYLGERGYLPGSFEISFDCEIIVTIVTRLEIKRIQEALETIDPTAFVYVQTIKEASGGVLKEKSHAK
jgi:uncharacterized membrane-anchored protein YitT (DUF2179 family)